MHEEESEDKSKQAQVARWFKEFKLADKASKKWCDSAKMAVKVYDGDAKPDGVQSGEKERSFNILWSNVEIKREAIYSALPAPDIRRRWRDEDQAGRAAAMVLERCVTYVMDCKDVDSDLIAACNDVLVPGRAITRLRLKSELEGEVVKSQDLETEQVQWDKFKHGPGKRWGEVPWIDFEHELHKDEVEKKWGQEIADKITYSINSENSEEKSDEDNELATVFSRAKIHEVWNKEDRKVYWIAESYKDDFLSVDDNPLGMRDFWPIPKPVYAIESSTSLQPRTEYSKYQVLAEELEVVTIRRNRIAKALRVRGVYDSQLGEMEKLLEAGDNKMIPMENASKYMERAGGLDSAVFFLPLEVLVNTFRELGVQRNELIGQIYELTGISDIVRGDTNPNETAAAQRIKGNFASMRLEKQRTAFHKYARDLVRLIVEVIAERFDRATLQRMSGLRFPTNEDKENAQLLLERAQLAPQSVPPEMIQQAQQLLQSNVPTWDEIEEILHDDLERDYRIDIETDSTIAIDKQREQQAISEFLEAIGSFLQAIQAAGGMGMVTPEAGKKMLLAVARRFQLGRDVEDELQKENPPQQEGPSPEEESKERMAKIDERMKQMEAQHKESMLELEEREGLMESRLKQLNFQIEQASLRNKETYEAASHERKMEELSAQPQ